MKPIKKKTILKVFKAILKINFLQRAGTFSFRGIVMMASLKVFNVSTGTASLWITSSMLIGAVVSFLGYLMSVKFSEGKVLRVAAILTPIFYLTAIYGINSKHPFLFLLGFIGILGLDGVSQSSIMSILQDLTISLSKYKTSLSRRVIAYFQFSGSSGIMLSLLIAPKLSYSVVLGAAFCFSLIQVFYIFSIQGKIKNSIKGVVNKVNTVKKSVHKYNSNLKLERSAVLKVIFLTLTITPQFAIISQLWTSWHLQAITMKQTVYGITIAPSQLITITPLMYIICIGLGNFFVKKKVLPMRLQFIIASILPTIASCIILLFQFLISKDTHLNIMWHLIPYLTSILGDSWYLILIFDFIQMGTTNNMKIISIGVANLRFLLGYLLNLVYSLTFDNSLMLRIFISTTIGILAFFCMVFISKGVKFKNKQNSKVGKVTKMVKKIKNIPLLVKATRRDTSLRYNPLIALKSESFFVPNSSIQCNGYNKIPPL
ncbi:MAG: hypothetical protein JJW01_03760 [Alphaproteobacteria bacterium]|nr:hypothetical protein [Rickettsiales bacterium]